VANSTTTSKPANGDREGMHGDHAQQALENRPTVDDPRGADRNADIVLGAPVLALGLLAGLFYDWSIAVMPGLTAADDRTLVDAMQQIDDAIQNPLFFSTFLGAPALAAVALVQARRSGSGKTAGLDRRRPRPLHGDGRRHLRGPHPAQRAAEGGG
jgi:hypothetical protein